MLVFANPIQGLGGMAVEYVSGLHRLLAHGLLRTLHHATCLRGMPIQNAFRVDRVLPHGVLDPNHVRLYGVQGRPAFNARPEFQAVRNLKARRSWRGTWCVRLVPCMHVPKRSRSDEYTCLKCSR